MITSSEMFAILKKGEKLSDKLTSVKQVKPDLHTPILLSDTKSLKTQAKSKQESGKNLWTVYRFLKIGEVDTLRREFAWVCLESFKNRPTKLVFANSALVSQV